MLRRLPELSPDDFRTHWLNTHLPMVRALPGVVAIRKGTVQAASAPELDYDAITEIAWADEAAFTGALASEAGQRAVADIESITESHHHYIFERIE
jgi:uncharacterized protein (TIGR02118 family)